MSPSRSSLVLHSPWEKRGPGEGDSTALWADLSPFHLMIVVILLWTSGRGTWIIGHLILIYIHESATANAPLTINGVPSLLGGPWSHVRHTPFLDACFFLATFFAAWLAPTLYKLSSFSETVTWTHNTIVGSTSPSCDLCNAHDVQPVHPEDEQHVRKRILFHCTHPHMVSPKDLCFPFFFCRLKQCVCFSGPGKQ